MSLRPCFSSSNTTKPRLIRARPYGVGRTPRGPRSRSRTPKEDSRSVIALETAGCEVARRSAALAMLPCWTTDMSTRKSCSLRRRSMRSAFSSAAHLRYRGSIYLYQRRIALVRYSGIRVCCRHCAATNSEVGITFKQSAVFAPVPRLLAGWVFRKRAYETFPPGIFANWPPAPSRFSSRVMRRVCANVLRPGRSA